jgi:hypothetical protein
MRLAASETTATRTRQTLCVQAIGARKEEAVGPDGPHQAGRCAERQPPIFGTGGNANAGAAIGPY